MKNRFILIFSAWALFAGALFAQGPQMQNLPNDPAVRKGQLENGMTYYIRHNDKPEKRAEFYLATNVGAIHQTPDQQGLAHFLEHMCFNGTKNFPGKGILDWLQGIGASFGGNVNASTGIEETQYMLNNIPLVRPTVVDTCLLIMHDYSHFVLNEPEEIDAERGVIIEERRSRRNASWRMMEKSFPIYFADGSKYATALTDLIGTQEQLESFKRESLVNFYETWYIPDNQALIVVGDIDVDEVEAKIKRIFSDIPKVENPTPRETYPFMPFDEPRVGVITDPEASAPNITVLWQSEATPEAYNSTPIGLMTDLLEGILGGVMSERFYDIISRPDATYLDGSFGITELSEATQAAAGMVALKEDNILGGFKDFMIQIEKMKRYGFTEAEVDRAKENILSRYEKAAKEAESRKNPEFVNALINNFFDNKPYMEPEVAYEMVKTIFSQINSTVVNQVIQQGLTDENFVIVYEGPEKPDIATPTREQLLAVAEEVKEVEIEAPEEEVVNEPFLDADALTGAPVVKTEKGLYGSTEWTLRNGIKVVVLPTDYKKDQILFNIEEKGGLSLVPDADFDSFDSNILSVFNQMSGISKFKGTQVSKMLTGKNLSVNPFLSSLRHGVSGNASVKDLETALQLVYLYYTDPRFDPEEYENGINQLKAVLPNLENQPNFILQKNLYKDIYENQERNSLISMEKIENANLATYEKYYRQMFANAGGAVMTVAGDLDLETLKPLVEKYIGSIPGGETPSNWIDRNDIPRRGTVSDLFRQKMETPLTTVVNVYNSFRPYSIQDAVMLDAVSYIMDQIYTETLREEEGGTYGASTSGDASIEPTPFYLLQVVFQCKPALSMKLRQIAVDNLAKLADEGPTDVQMTRTIENFKKNLPEKRITNNYWLSNLQYFSRYGVDYDQEYEAAIGQLTKDNIQKAAQLLIYSGNFIEVVMLPGQTAEKE